MNTLKIESNDKNEVIKLINYGKNKTYIYSAIVLINGIYFWTNYVHFQNKKDIKTHDFTKENILKELNQKNIDKYVRTF